MTRLADRLTGRDLTERYIIGLRTWDAVLRGEPAHIALHHAERALAGGLGWADPDRGFEVPVLVALAFTYADRPGTIDGWLRKDDSLLFELRSPLSTLR